MKKFILPVIMGALFIIGLSTTVSSTASEPPVNSTICKSLCPTFVELGWFESMGTCMSSCNVCVNPGGGKYAFAVCLCTQVADNVGQCIQEVKTW
jgi:hypothetical protein